MNASDVLGTLKCHPHQENRQQDRTHARLLGINAAGRWRAPKNQNGNLRRLVCSAGGIELKFALTQSRGSIERLLEWGTDSEPCVCAMHIMESTLPAAFIGGVRA